jgi:predicted enzyme related to lactoylglutathione lyase
MQLGARQTIVAPQDIPNVGRFAVLLDPTGAAIALIKGL